MIPFIVFVIAAITFWLIGRAGVTVFQDVDTVLRVALGLMFLLTASAHWGKRRPDLIRMVPSIFPRPGSLVTITGILEILGGLGLFIPSTARAAATCLAIFLIAIFPANVHAARQKLTIAGRPVPKLPFRTAMQIVFIAALLGAACLK